MVTIAPALARALAIAAPMPEAAPVMRAVLSLTEEGLTDLEKSTGEEITGAEGMMLDNSLGEEAAR